ncbi:MAG: CapA family protein [Lachnospiraceae bacterium]|nr:CapA family protein [Lachnospiraceae bacterium]
MGEEQNEKSGWLKHLALAILIALMIGGAACGGLNYYLRKCETCAPVPASGALERVSADEIDRRLAEREEERRLAAEKKAEEERLKKEAEEAERLRLEEEERIRNTPETVTFAFAGDILFDNRYATGQVMAARGGFAPCLKSEVQDVMRGVDVMVINNEFPYTDGSSPQPDKEYTFHAGTSTASWLIDAGIDLAALANNHTFDYGEEGLLDTLHTLEDIGMPYIGAGRNLDEAAKPAVYAFGDFTVAVLNATQIERFAVANTRGATETESGVFRCFDPEELYARVEKAKEEYDYVIVFMHWGTEKEVQPDWGQLDQQQGLYEAGADIVIGAHPHVLQGFTYIGEMPIVYSLGNFLFTSHTLDTGIIRLTFAAKEKRLDSLQFLPMLQEGCEVKMLSGEEKERVLNDLRNLSSGVTIDADGYIRRAE